MTDFVCMVVLIGAAVLWVFIIAFWVHVYRSDGTSSTPADGLSTPRIVPPAGPQHPARVHFPALPDPSSRSVP